MEKSGYGRDGIFRSLRPPLTIPKTTNKSMISFLFRNVSSYPNKPALYDSDSGETLTFSQFKTTVAKLSHAFNTQLGITKNDVVLIFAPNSIQYPVTVYSIIALGAIITTVNPQYTVGEISKQIKDSNPKVIITVQDLYEKVANFGLPVVFLGSGGVKKGCFYVKDLILRSGSVSELPKVEISGDHTAALLYSSGTTGVSKGVVLSHMNFIAVSQMLTSDQRLMGGKDYLQEGNAVVSMGKFDFTGMLKNVEKYRVTHLWVVPPVFLALAKQEVVNKFDLSSLKQLGSGAAPLGKELMEECAKKLPHVVALQWNYLVISNAYLHMGYMVSSVNV
ncbi:putative AMP-dependent synthetase/ligase, AMP-binding, ANL domain-containing protein [Helianthus annuus]|nr:putative AMP-dependent synthetase/ligase, AMP-binding, ANL domain-containing protein [Helianthus annuus]